MRFTSCLRKKEINDGKKMSTLPKVSVIQVPAGFVPQHKHVGLRRVGGVDSAESLSSRRGEGRTAGDCALDHTLRPLA